MTFGYDSKVKLQKNWHPVDTVYYARIIFYQYLVQARVRCNHLFTFWGMVTTGSSYAVGVTRAHHNSFFGHSITFKTFMKKAQEF